MSSSFRKQLPLNLISNAAYFILNVLIGVWINVPWVAVPYYAFATWVGVRLLGLRNTLSLPEVGFSELFSRSFWAWLAGQWRLLIPAFAGSVVLSVALALLAYPLALLFIRRFRAIRRGE